MTATSFTSNLPIMVKLACISLEPPTYSHLQLNTACTKADFDLTLGRWLKNLKTLSMDSNTLSFVPKLAHMNIPTKQNNNKAISSTDGDNLHHDIANPLVVDDYSVYGELENY